jgi:hypothetical protein
LKTAESDQKFGSDSHHLDIYLHLHHPPSCSPRVLDNPKR